MTTSLFKAEWSTPVIISTVVLLAVVLTAAFFLLRTFSLPGTGMKLLGGGVLAALLGTLVFSYLLSPLGYAIDGENLTIVRRLRPISIRLADIQEVRVSSPALMAGSIRLLGNDGLWGRYGRYHSPDFGAYHLYVRSGRAPVLVQGPEKYVLGPERPEEFVQSLNRAVAAARLTAPAN
jgi:hypothetical protein